MLLCGSSGPPYDLPTPTPNQRGYPGSGKDILKTPVSFLSTVRLLRQESGIFPQESHAWPKKRLKPAPRRRSARALVLLDNAHVRPHSRGDLSAGSAHGPDLTGMAHCPASFALFKPKPQDPTNGPGRGGVGGIPELLCSSP